jgi:hypothetical protein
MLKKLVLIAVVLIALLATTTLAFAATELCDPPPTPGQTRNFKILCYFDTSYTGTTEMGTKDQPFKTFEQARAQAESHTYGGYVIDKQTGVSTPYEHTVTGSNGASISRTAMFALLGLASLILVAVGWFLMQRARNLPHRI